MTKLCAIDGCESIVRARGLCSRHEQAARAHGSIGDAPRDRGARGGGTIGQNGYRYIGRDLEHILVAERALGHELPPGAEVHHFNEIRSDNRPGNRVICPDHAYHALLHLRRASLAAIGRADGRRCTYCKQWDAPDKLTFASSGAGASAKVFHPDCRNAYRRQRRAITGKAA